MSNERITENHVRDQLRDLGYYESNDVTVEEQASARADIKRLLKSASKQGGGGRGAPEFIITSAEHPDFVIVFECKADTAHHRSELLDRPVDFAVDGAPALRALPVEVRSTSSPSPSAGSRGRD